MKKSISLLPYLSFWRLLRPEGKKRVFPLSGKHQNFYFERNAIWHGIQALNLQPGDEVLMPAYNSDTEEQVLEHAGLKIVYHDVGLDTRVDFDGLEKYITSKTRALYVIHYFGLAQDMQQARAFCQKHGLFLIEDCALSLFSKTDDIPLGSVGDIAFFCLRKFIEIPNGGTLVFNNQSISKEFSDLRQPPFFSTAAETTGLLLNWIAQYLTFLEPLTISIKKAFRMTLGSLRTPSGDPVVEKSKFSWRASKISEYILARLDYHAIEHLRLSHYAYLKEQLQSVVEKSDKLDFFPAKEQKGFVPFCFPLLVDDNLWWKKSLAEYRIEAGAWWRHDKRVHEKETFENNKYLRRHVLELPIQHTLNRSDLDAIVDAIKALA